MKGTATTQASTAVAEAVGNAELAAETWDTAAGLAFDLMKEVAQGQDESIIPLIAVETAAIVGGGMLFSHEQTDAKAAFEDCESDFKAAQQAAQQAYTNSQTSPVVPPAISPAAQRACESLRAPADEFPNLNQLVQQSLDQAQEKLEERLDEGLSVAASALGASPDQATGSGGPLDSISERFNNHIRQRLNRLKKRRRRLVTGR